MAQCKYLPWLKKLSLFTLRCRKQHGMVTFKTHFIFPMQSHHLENNNLLQLVLGNIVPNLRISMSSSRPEAYLIKQIGY